MERMTSIGRHRPAIAVALAAVLLSAAAGPPGIPSAGVTVLSADALSTTTAAPPTTQRIAVAPTTSTTAPTTSVPAATTT
ncbi:MAG: hypothetical protein ABMA25_29395, partial [Ilumatobacteraceae bacterium]